MNRLEAHLILDAKEQYANRIIAAIGDDMPDKAAHKRWLLTLKTESLKARLQMILNESGEKENLEVPNRAAREIRIPTSTGNRVALHEDSVV